MKPHNTYASYPEHCALTQVGDAALAVLVDKYVFALKVSVGDGRLSLGAEDLHVEVCQAAGDGQGQNDHAVHRHCVPVQVVEQGAVLVVLCHQPQLGPRAVICNTKTAKGMVIHLGVSVCVQSY